MAQHYIGIDLGTMESTVSCISIESMRDDPIEKLHPLKIYQFDKNYHFDMDKTGLQSSIFIDRNSGRTYTGEYAKKLYADGDRPLQAFKVRIGTKSLIQVPLANNRMDDVLSFDMTELSALLLKTIRLSINRQIEERDIVHTTITIPAAFNDDERREILNIAKLAGFNEVYILYEPIALCLDCLNAKYLSGIFNFNADKKILVYDIGSEILDISILKLFSNKDKSYTVEILECSPRINLGGDDIDKYIAAYCLSEFEKINPSIEDREEDEQAKIVSRIVSNAESAKINFNTKILPYLDNERRRKKIKQSINFEIIDGLSITDLTLTDESLREILFDLIGKEGKLIVPIRSVLTSARLSPEDIDLVVLTGGSGKFYLVRETLDGFFGGNVEILEYTEGNAVSKGAAIHSYNQTEEGLRKVNIDDIMSDDTFIKTETGFDLLVPAHTDPGDEGTYEYKFERLSNRLEVFLYYGSGLEEPYKYKEIAGVFKTLDKFYDTGENVEIKWKLDENKILHIYYNDELLVNTADNEATFSDLVEYYVLNEGKV